MTEQIVIKLNHEKFKPLLDDFNEKILKNSSQSYSWLVGFTVWYMHKFMFDRNEIFDNKTRVQILLEKRGITLDEAILIYMGEFIEFLKTGRLSSQQIILTP